MSIMAEIHKRTFFKMKTSLFCWCLLVVLACGAGATIHFMEGWPVIAILVAIAIIVAFVATILDYKANELYEKQFRVMRIIYVATAIIATWPLLVCVVSESVYLTSVAVTTIPLIGVCIRRALQGKD